MTPERFAEIRAREQLAQAGPWTYHMDGQSESQLTAGENIYAVDYILSCCNVDERTLQFIAHARQDIPDLLNELAAANQRVEQAEQRAAALREALVKANSLVSGGICVIGARGKDAYIRQIGSVLDDALAASGGAAPAEQAGGE